MRAILRRRVRRTTIMSSGCAAFLAGVGLVRIGWAVPGVFALAGVCLLVLCWRKVLVVAVPAVIACGLLLGLWRGGQIDRRLAWYRSAIDRKVIVTGDVVQDSTYGTKKQIDFMITNVVSGGVSLPGSVHVTTFNPVEPKQGDHIRAGAKLKSGFGGYQAGLYYADVSVLGRGNSWITTIRRQFSAVILSVIPEPHASLGLGFLLGIKSQLPQELTDQLKIVGLTHIVVASGYNLTILVRAARRALAGRSKYQATLAALLMIGFLGVTGLSPSMSRAALVTSLSLAAWYYGRIVHPVLLLLASAAITAAVNPLYVWGDLGWCLSFLAFAGVMLGAPLLQKRLFGSRQAPQIAQIVLETLCAELATLPLIMLIFGSVSTLGLLANVLVAPLVPLAMLAVFVAGLGAIILPGAGTWLALPAYWVLEYMTTIISQLAVIPWAQQAISIGPLVMVFCYVVLLALGAVGLYKTKHNYLGKTFVE